jgi:hypothetical protein
LPLRRVSVDDIVLIGSLMNVLNHAYSLAEAGREAMNAVLELMVVLGDDSDSSDPSQCRIKEFFRETGLLGMLLDNHVLLSDHAKRAFKDASLYNSIPL